jgi:hypothetical protein
MHDSNAQQLRREFADIEFKEGESVDEFSLQMTTLADNLRTLGDEVTEAEVVKKLLQVVPDSLEQAAVAIEMLLDLNTTSVEEVTGRLRVFEHRRQKKKPPTEAMGKLLLTEDEWRARDKANGSSRGSSSSSGGKNRFRGKHGRGSGTGTGGGGASSDPRSGFDAGRAATRNDICKSCGKRGHWAKDYRSRPRREHAHVAQDDEEALMYVEACVDLQSAGNSTSHRIAAGDSGDISTAPAPPSRIPDATYTRSSSR